MSRYVRWGRIVISIGFLVPAVARAQQVTKIGPEDRGAAQGGIAAADEFLIVGASSGPGLMTPLAYVYSQENDHWVLEDMLVDPSNRGSTFALPGTDGNRAIIGLPFDDGEKGRAFIFSREDANWTFEQELVRPGGDRFGEGVSISGEYAAVGAPTSGAGVVFVFERQNGAWNLKSTIEDTDPPQFSRFGSEVSLSWPYLAILDGQLGRGFLFRDHGGEWQLEFSTENTFAIDVSGTTVAMSRSASHLGRYVLIRELNPDMGSWIDTERLQEGDYGYQSTFGKSIDLNGSTLIVGAPDECFGPACHPIKQDAAHVFERESGSWKRTAIVSQGQGFGSRVTASGTLAAVAIPEGNEPMLVFGINLALDSGLKRPTELSRGAWTRAVAVDDTVAAVTNHGYGVSVYQYTRSEWKEVCRLTPSDSTDLRFGLDLVIVGNDLFLTDGGIVHLYKVSKTGCVRQNEPGDSFAIGWQIAASTSTLAIGSFDGVHIFDHQGSVWKEIDSFETSWIAGGGLDVSSGRILVGSEYSEIGEARLYEFQDGSWQLKRTLPAPEFHSNSAVGLQVSLSDRFAAIGGPISDNSGVVYVYDLMATEDEPIEFKTMRDPRSLPVPSAVTFALRDNALLLGDPVNRRVQVYEYDGENWIEREPIRAIDIRKEFPSALAVNADKMIVGTKGNFDGAHVFDFEVGLETVTNVPAAKSIRSGSVTLSTFPDPVRTLMNLELKTPGPGRVRVDIFDALGRRVTTILDQFVGSTSYSSNVNVSQLSSGLYFATVLFRNKTASARPFIIRQ